MRGSLERILRCPGCGQAFSLEVLGIAGEDVREGALLSACGLAFPVINGVPRILPADLAVTLETNYPSFFERHPTIRPTRATRERPMSVRTLRAFGDEWRRFPEILDVHERVFSWYFEGPEAVRWQGLRVLDAGCGMGRWLHFALRAGATVVGIDVSSAIDLAAERNAGNADFVQADLRWPPFAPETFDLVYSLGVVHHLEVPLDGVRSLARLVREGGELRLYVYRSLADDPWPRRALLGAVGVVRRMTTRVPFWAVHAMAWTIAALGTALFLVPRRLLRRSALGDRITQPLPLVQYTDVPFRMLVAEQFDRLCAPIEGRYRREDVAGWLEAAGLQVRAILPGLGWRAIAFRPLA